MNSCGFNDMSILEVCINVCMGMSETHWVRAILERNSVP